jgi:hypothetical protein
VLVGELAQLLRQLLLCLVDVAPGRLDLGRLGDGARLRRRRRDGRIRVGEPRLDAPALPLERAQA